ncbi:hypothetical protein NW765_004127 [Fusarium oxysporum]|nr:hypothetical protein NW765_004127 [Fusarium oxysporum]
MKDSDRMPHLKEPTLLPALYDFINHQLTRFVVILLVVVASVRLLTTFLLWEDESDDDDRHADTDPTLDVKSFTGGHRLDVVMLAAAADGHVVSVGLDRTIQVWDARHDIFPYTIVDGCRSDDAPFPVLAMTIDDNSKWLAILSPSKIALWNIKDKVWGASALRQPSRPEIRGLLFRLVRHKQRYSSTGSRTQKRDTYRIHAGRK